MFVVVVFTFPGYFSRLPALHPGFSSLWRSPPVLSSTLATFNCFTLPSTTSATVLSGRFLPTGIFYLRTFLPQPAFIKASRGAGSSSMKLAGLYADPKNTDPAHLFVWLTAIHNLDIQKNWYLNRTKYYHLWWNVSLSAPYSFWTIFACWKSYGKTIKNTSNKACTAYNRFDETTHQSCFEKAATRKAA